MATGFISGDIPTSVAAMEADLLDYIESWHAKPLLPYNRHPGMPTFTYLQGRYGKQGIGGMDLNLTGYNNVVLWQGLSDNLATAIVNLCQSGEIHWHETFAIAYIEEGKPLPLPLARWPVTEKYDKPHWLPVHFVPGPSCDDLHCPNNPNAGRVEKLEDDR